MYKTGTTSFGKAMRNFGLRSFFGPWETVKEDIKGNSSWDFDAIQFLDKYSNDLIKLIENFDAFNDYPFMFIYEWLAKKYPDSLFVFLERDPLSLAKSDILMWERFNVVPWKIPDKKKFIDRYNNHKEKVLNFFENNNQYDFIRCNVKNNHDLKLIYEKIGTSKYIYAEKKHMQWPRANIGTYSKLGITKLRTKNVLIYFLKKIKLYSFTIILLKPFEILFKIFLRLFSFILLSPSFLLESIVDSLDLISDFTTEISMKISDISNEIKEERNLRIFKNSEENKKTNKIKQLNFLKNKVYNPSYSSWKFFKELSTPYIVSIPNNKKRCEITFNHLKNLGLNPKISYGVTPRNINNHLSYENQIPLSKSKPTQTACLISHLLTIHQALNESKSNYIFIVEDDTRLFPDPLITGLKNLFTKPVLSRWDVLQLEHHSKNAYWAHQKTRPMSLVQRWQREWYGCSAYILKRNYAEKFLSKFYRDRKKPKFDLTPAYTFGRHLVIDQLVYDMGDSLSFTFPLSTQTNLNDESSIGYEDEVITNKIQAELLTIREWKRFASYLF